MYSFLLSQALIVIALMCFLFQIILLEQLELLSYCPVEWYLALLLHAVSVFVFIVSAIVSKRKLKGILHCNYMTS